MILLNGSDSGDETIDERDDDEDDDASCISGDFINDGAYTQHPSQGGDTAQAACMYLAVNNYRMQMESPDDLDSCGKPNIRKIFRSKAQQQQRQLLMQQSSVVDSSGGTSYTSYDDGTRSPVIEVPKGDPSPAHEDDEEEDEDGEEDDEDGDSDGSVLFDLSALKPVLKSKGRSDHHHHHHPAALVPIAKKLRFSTSATPPPPLPPRLHHRRRAAIPDLCSSSSDDSDDDDDDPHVSCNPYTLKILKKFSHNKNKRLVGDENAVPSSSSSCRGGKGQGICSPSRASKGKGKGSFLRQKVINREPLAVIAVHGNSKRSDTTTTIDDDDNAILQEV